MSKYIKCGDLKKLKQKQKNNQTIWYDTTFLFQVNQISPLY